MLHTEIVVVRTINYKITKTQSVITQRLRMPIEIDRQLIRKFLHTIILDFLYFASYLCQFILWLSARVCVFNRKTYRSATIGLCTHN